MHNLSLICAVDIVARRSEKKPGVKTSQAMFSQVEVMSVRKLQPKLLITDKESHSDVTITPTAGRNPHCDMAWSLQCFDYRSFDAFVSSL